MSYFLDQKNKYLKGQPSQYDVQDDSDERIFHGGDDNEGNQTDESFAAQTRLNNKWVK